MPGIESLTVEIAYACDGAQYAQQLRVPYGTTLRGVIERSRLVEQHPEIDLERWRVGIFGVLVSLDTIVGQGDRVEIYPPLRCDPKVARRRRAARGAAAK